MKKFISGLLALGLVFSLSGNILARSSPYTLAVVDVSDGKAIFSVTRTEPSDDVMWVHVECDVPVASNLADETPVIWGFWDSLDGYAVLDVTNSSCTAWLTKTPWKVRHSDLSITF